MSSWAAEQTWQQTAELALARSEDHVLMGAKQMQQQTVPMGGQAWLSMQAVNKARCSERLY
jgi:hypothetical protein